MLPMLLAPNDVGLPFLKVSVVQRFNTFHVVFVHARRCKILYVQGGHVLNRNKVSFDLSVWVERDSEVVSSFPRVDFQLLE